MNHSIAYVAFLRAVNVGGRTVKMEKLRNVLTERGFAKVRTYIQSGNVFFESAEFDRTKIISKIETLLLEQFGFEVPAILLTLDELRSAISSAPFNDLQSTPETRHCLIFLSGDAPSSLLEPFRSDKLGFEIIGGRKREVYVIMHVTDGKVGNPASYIEKKTGLKATARFFHTSIKILEAAEEKRDKI